MRCIVSNTGPVFHLYEAQALDLLALADALFIPPAVETELAHLIPDWQRTRPAWLKLETPTAPHLTETIVWQQIGLLDWGETEAIALARQMRS